MPRRRKKRQPILDVRKKKTFSPLNAGEKTPTGKLEDLTREQAEARLKSQREVEMSTVKRKKRYKERLSKLHTERSSWDSHWQDIADHLLPRRVRFEQTDRSNAGSKKNRKILNNTATRALRILASGMMAGITSPSRPWFKLVSSSPEVMRLHRVRRWLADVEERMRTIFARSNTYNGLAQVYEDLAAFGTPLMYIESDDKDVLRTSVLPIGSFYLAQDEYGRVHTVYRKLSMTVEQLVSKFGRENCSSPVRDAYDRGRLDDQHTVVHVVEKNVNMESGREDFRGMPFISVWYEEGSEEEGKLLSEGGYEEFPYASPRWSVTGQDVYATGCPGMDALGDIRGLQHMEQRRAQGLDKVVNPTMKAPLSLRGHKSSVLSGDVTYVDEIGNRGRYEPAHTVDPRSIDLAGELERHEHRINSTFMADLFLMLSQQPMRSDVTAREIEERHEEKMLQLGPVLERLQDELLKPLIDRTFGIMLRFGLIPDPPPELEGDELEVRYISIFAQAQQLPAASSIERTVAFVQALAGIDETAADVLDSEAAARRYQAVTGAPPDIIKDEEEVAATRAERQRAAQMQQAQMAAAAAKDGAGAVRDLSQADIGGTNAMNAITRAYTGRPQVSGR